MSGLQIITLVIFVLAGALLGYQRWKSGGELPQPQESVEVRSEEGDPSVIPPVERGE